MKKFFIIFGSILFLAVAVPTRAADTAGALVELSTLVGHTVTTTTEAHDLCQQEQYMTSCAEIGKKYKLYDAERAKAVDTILEQLKGAVINQLKACTDAQCVLNVATVLSKKLATKDPKLSEKLNLTTQKIEEHKAVVDAAKENGVTLEQCKKLNTASVSLDKLQACSKFSGDARVQARIPEAKKAEHAQSQKMVEFRTALANKTIICGDNTIEGCTKYCFPPRQVATGSVKPTPVPIPDVCKEIVKKYFGPDATKYLEQAHQTPPPRRVDDRAKPASNSPGLISRFLDFLSF